MRRKLERPKNRELHILEKEKTINKEHNKKQNAKRYLDAFYLEYAEVIHRVSCGYCDVRRSKYTLTDWKNPDRISSCMKAAYDTIEELAKTTDLDLRNLILLDAGLDSINFLQSIYKKKLDLYEGTSSLQKLKVTI